MRMDDQIKAIIEKEFNPEHFELINESHKHVGHAGDDGSGQTHYILIVVSDRFLGRARLECQRMVMDALKTLFDKGLHAVQLRLSPPE